MLFFELLQIAIGNRTGLSQTPTAEEWWNLYTLAQKQAMVGITFRGVEQLPEMQRPPKPLLMQWYMATEQIKKMNVDLDRKALKVANNFLEDGFPGWVLKGQGVAKLYRVEKIENSKLKVENYHPDGDTKHNRLNAKQESRSEGDRRSLTVDCRQEGRSAISEYRTPGDIDIWLHGSRDKILDYVRRYVPHCKPVYHHVDFPVVDGLDIEVHFTPSWMNSPVTNRRLQRFFKSTVNSQQSTDGHWPLAVGGNKSQEIKVDNAQSASQQPYSELPVQSLAFNRVYILVHIYRHLFAEGIGLRQLLDYYFVLQQGCSVEERAATMRVLRSLRMKRFTAAVMWVLQQVFGMDDRYLLTSPNEQEGRFLLNEIMMAGNFGQYDERMQHERGESAMHWGLRKVKRNFRFVRSYPSEVLWSPIFKLWHWWWRKKRL